MRINFPATVPFLIGGLSMAVLLLSLTSLRQGNQIRELYKIIDFVDPQPFIFVVKDLNDQAEVERMTVEFLNQHESAMHRWKQARGIK